MTIYAISAVWLKQIHFMTAWSQRFVWLWMLVVFTPSSVSARRAPKRLVWGTQTFVDNCGPSQIDLMLWVGSETSWILFFVGWDLETPFSLDSSKNSKHYTGGHCVVISRRSNSNSETQRASQSFLNLSEPDRKGPNFHRRTTRLVGGAQLVGINSAFPAACCLEPGFW